MPVFEHPVKHVLYKILTQFPLIGHMKKKTEQLAVVALKQQSHPVKIAVLYL